MPETTPNKSAAWNWLVIGVVLIGGLVYLAISRKNAAASLPPMAAATSGAGEILETNNVIGRTAPNWTLKDVDGKPVSLSQFAGHPVVLDFWATWCGPCQIEMPWWKQLQDEYRGQGLVIVGISEDQHFGDVKNYVKKNPFNYQIVWDDNSLQATYGSPFGLPTTLFINRAGKITGRVAGLEGKPELEKAIRGIL
ncbi:MAG TPA: redoxin domain-containing protein [Terriglobales bacterium]|nr:redoxin domain-containing protein [Terriglobales bacterium]